VFDGEGVWLQLDEEAKSLMLIQGFLDIGVLGVPQDHVLGEERIKQLLRLI